MQSPIRIASDGYLQRSTLSVSTSGYLGIQSIPPQPQDPSGGGGPMSGARRRRLNLGYVPNNTKKALMLLLLAEG